MLKKSSQELLHQMGQYLECNIPMTREFNLGLMKSMGSQMT